MRLSILALFIALPAAAYASVNPRQTGSVSVTSSGTQGGGSSQNFCYADETSCQYDSDCCSYDCSNYVRVHSLLFALGADPNAGLRFQWLTRRISSMWI
jgi:hypothetical protein